MIHIFIFYAFSVNAVKIRLFGDRDFIELDRSELGKTYEDFLSVLAAELRIKQNEITCVRKLPDVIVRNDEDLVRILPGHRLEVETLTSKLIKFCIEK